MLFPLRAAVVIGGLSYLAILRDRPDAVPSLPVPVQGPPARALSLAWDAVPAETREQIVREGADAVLQHLAGRRAASADTLAEADRRPPWRGAASR